MSGFQAQMARLTRAAEVVVPVEETKPQPVAVALSEAAETLPPHVIAATDPVKLNTQAPIFRCPAWAGLPSRPYHLHCERGGVPFPALALHRFPYYLFGKNAVCDYVLEHPSVSSVHAALIFHKEHECFVLLDLGSTNGTRVAGKRVEARKPTPIAVGSALQFGYSTRTYELRTGAAAAVKRSRDEDGPADTAVAPATRVSSAAATSTAAPSPPLSSTPHAQPSGAAVATSSSSVAVSPQANRGEEASAVAAAKEEEEKQERLAHPSPAQEPAPAATAEVAESPSAPAAIHLYQLVIKHKDVDNPVSRGHNKGEVITRSKADALEMVRFILQEHDGQAPTNASRGHSPWTVEEFVAAVREYCEVSSKKKAGDLGMVEKGTFSEVIDEAAFKLRVGEVSAPVETQLGIHLLFRCD